MFQQAVHPPEQHCRLSTACPLAVRPADLVFIQNGMLQPWLDERGLGDATQVRAALDASGRWLPAHLAPSSGTGRCCLCCALHPCHG